MAPSFNSEVIPISEVPGLPQPAETAEPQLILVVDDEPIVADTLAVVLSRMGFKTLAAYGARSALELAAITPPAFLITDVHMPEMDGIELAMTMVKISPACKVLLFSGHAVAADLAEAHAAGYNFPLLAKPVHPEEIIRHVSHQLGRKDGAHQNLAHSIA